jgi:hypothetical protein
MDKKSSLAGTLVIVGMLLIFTAIPAMGSVATAANSPEDFSMNKFTVSVKQTSPPVRLAQFTNPPAGWMLGGAGIFAPPGIINPPGVSGGMFFVPEQESDVPITPRTVNNPYRRCPYGGFDCDL